MEKIRDTHACQAYEAKVTNKQIKRGAITLVAILAICVLFAIFAPVSNVGSFVAMIFGFLMSVGLGIPNLIDSKKALKESEKWDNDEGLVKFSKGLKSFGIFIVIAGIVLIIIGLIFFFV